MRTHPTRTPLGPSDQCPPPQVSERFQELGHQFNLAMMGLRSLHSQMPRPPEPLPLVPSVGPVEDARVSRHHAKGRSASRSLEGFDASLRGMPLVLRYLLEHGGSAYPSELKKATGLTQARISNALAGLESRGLVERAADGKDRRHVVVTLTEAGCHAVTERMSAMDSYAGGLLELLGESDACELVRIVQKLSQILEAEGSLCRETPAAAADETAGAKVCVSVGEDREDA